MTRLLFSVSNMHTAYGPFGPIFFKGGRCCYSILPVRMFEVCWCLSKYRMKMRKQQQDLTSCHICKQCFIWVVHGSLLHCSWLHANTRLLAEGRVREDYLDFSKKKIPPPKNQNKAVNLLSILWSIFKAPLSWIGLFVKILYVTQLMGFFKNAWNKGNVFI